MARATPSAFGHMTDRIVQSMVAPDTRVGDVHSLFALAGGRDDRAIHVDRGPGEELGRLAGPNLEPGVVDGVLQCSHVVLAEAAAEVTGRGGVGDAWCAECVEKNLVVAAEFDIFQTGAVAKHIESDVQHVIGLGVRAVDLEEVQALVDRLIEPNGLSEREHGADAAIGDAAGPLGEFVADVLRSEDPRRRDLLGIQPLEDLLLATRELGG